MAKHSNVRGIEKHQEVRASQRYRDVRTLTEKIRDSFEKSDTILLVTGMGLALMFLMPRMMEIAGLATALILFLASKLKFSLPFRTPLRAQILDQNTLHPGTGQPQIGEGITYFGNDRDDKKELWFDSSDVRTHILIFGTTGAGKTELLLSIAYNSLVQGSGFIFVDGKGANETWAKVFSSARSLGREDDLLIINYMTGGRDVFGPQKSKLSNTMNPFIKGSSGGLTEMLVGLMDSSGGGNGDMWQGRAISLISAIMMCLVWLRDNTGLLLDVDVIREHLNLENIQQLAARRDLPPQALSAVRAYLKSLPGYVENPPGGQQNDTAREQHGYLQMQFTKILGSLSDTYGYIFRTNLGEVDFTDVVLNRRILMVLLPAMEKSSAELRNLGKIIVSSLKEMMATGLGSLIEGDWSEVIDAKPTNSPSPYTCILDEYGYYVVEGAAVMPAQARSLGFCMVFAGQDYPAFKKNNMGEEAASTIANCNIKIFMKTEDTTETAELFQKSVGEALISQSSGYARKSGTFGISYQDQESVSVERRARGDILDLKAQGNGEAHIIFRDSLVRAKVFYANPAKLKSLRVNSFLRVEPPELEEMTEFQRQTDEIIRKIRNPSLAMEFIDDSETVSPQLQLFANTYNTAEIRSAEAGEKETMDIAAMAAIDAVYNQAYSTIDAFRANAAGLGGAVRNPFNIFSPIDDFDEDDDWDDEDDGDYDEDGNFRNLDPVRMNRDLSSMGMDRDEVAQLERELRQISAYPKHTPDPIDPDDLLEIIQNLDDRIGGELD